MNQMTRKSEVSHAQTALEDALTALAVATRALEDHPNPEPWSRERLDHAHAQDLLRHAQRRVDHLYQRP